MNTSTKIKKSFELPRKYLPYNLNELSGEIINSLLKKSSTINELCSELTQKRTTLLYNLKNMEIRKLVKKEVDFGAQNIYKINPINEKSRPKEKHTKINMLTVNECYELINKNNSSKLFGIQGDLSIEFQCKELLSQSDKHEKLHKIQKQKAVILEAVISEKALSFIKKLPKETISTHFGRPMIISKLPNNFNSENDILFDSNNVYIINPIKNTAFVIREQSVRDTFFVLYSKLKEGSQSITQNEAYSTSLE
jgi:predicted transcriptional regulator